MPGTWPSFSFDLGMGNSTQVEDFGWLGSRQVWEIYNTFSSGILKFCVIR